MTTSWGGVADWYEKLLAGDDTYQARVILPNLLRLLAPLEGKRILDIGCGSGFFASALVQAGAAEVVGVDLGPELIQKARKAVPLEKGKFYVASADQIGKVVKENDFDAAIMVLSLQNIEHYREAIAEAAGKLAKGSPLYIILNHPAFRIPKHSGWAFDEARGTEGAQYRTVYEYLSESRAEIDMHPGAGASVAATTTAGTTTASAEQTISFHRPLQSYFKAFEKAGLAVTRLEEWVSHKKSELGGTRQVAEDRSRKEIPLFMMLEVRRVG